MFVFDREIPTMGDPIKVEQLKIGAIFSVDSVFRNGNEVVYCGQSFVVIGRTHLNGPVLAAAIGKWDSNDPDFMEFPNDTLVWMYDLAAGGFTYF